VVTPSYEKGAASATPSLFLSDNSDFLVFLPLIGFIGAGLFSGWLFYFVQ